MCSSHEYLLFLGLLGLLKNVYACFVSAVLSISSSARGFISTESTFFFTLLSQPKVWLFVSNGSE